MKRVSFYSVWQLIFLSGGSELSVFLQLLESSNCGCSYSDDRLLTLVVLQVGLVIGKGGETIKYLQHQSGARIQVARDGESDPRSSTRQVELMGTPEQISRAEQLVKDVIAEVCALHATHSQIY